ncbi:MULTISPECIES: sulfotransferase [unclassified Okeania]|uniref:sulfotransferase family protein n=1 Tax=unclassified Okeania TaxID=2634635 RepID=UPI0013BB6832|nr:MULTISPECIES: sulfotransferase [unclassified Okeania]NET12498.1 sulfotransferase [Okeania sp. SIO1H6]NES76455.1 sulfotransferase [Okeania sp. SIO1H4]NET22463.1 sulfotransferase [Okeania sp. SIO1H5]NET79400.1 sulfotransferase [Okeania sp. SIO1F9]NET95926.1 sulfotransferase [Okeania sp. SIO1H2]
MKKKVLFILGTAYCGSTLLSLILDSHPQCFTVGELSNLPDFNKKGKLDDFWSHQFSEKELHNLSLGLSNARISPAIPLKVEKFFREIVNDHIFRPYSIIASKTPADIIVDSTKTIYWISSMLRLKELKKEFDIYLLHLVRDGRAVLNSYLKKRRNMTVKEISYLWLERVTNNEVFFDNFYKNKILVRYEMLVTQLPATVQQVCDFLGIEFRPEMLDYWKYEHNIISGNTGTRTSMNKYKNSLEEKQNSTNSLIKLDTSWLTEMTEDTIREFYAIVGNKNSPYEWDYE